MSNAKLLHKQRVRFTVEVEVSIMDFPQALIDGTETESKYENWKAENPKDFVEDMEFQKRLLYAVLNNPEVVSQLILNDAGNEAATRLGEEYQTNYGQPSTNEIISPVINTLDSKDKKRVNELIKHEVLLDNTEAALFDAFEATVISSDFEYLK